MISTQNDLSETKQKTDPYPKNNFQYSIHKDSSYDNVWRPQPHKIQNCDPCTFIVPWQLPRMKNQDYD
jgi:hypothetical protein